jgi:hypothetical protein
VDALVLAAAIVAADAPAASCSPTAADTGDSDGTGAVLLATPLTTGRRRVVTVDFAVVAVTAV